MGVGVSNWLEIPKRRFIVLGKTAELGSSKRIIYRYKSEDELRDIFITNKMTKKALKELLIFKVVSVDDLDTWYLISFDIKEVIGRKSGKRRRATKEYTIIKEHMFFNLCGGIDNSTYICPEPQDDYVKDFTSYVELYRVKPFDNKTLEAMKESLIRTIIWIRIQQLLAKKDDEEIRRKREKRLDHGRGRKKFKEIIERLRESLNIYSDKVVRLIGQEPIKQLKKETDELEKKIEEKASVGDSNQLDKQ